MTLISVLDCQNLGSSIADRPTPLKQPLVFWNFFCKSEVNQDGCDYIIPQSLFFYHDVLQFDVPMHDSFFVEVVEGLEEVSDDLFGVLLFEGTFFLDKSVKSDVELFSDEVHWILALKGSN